MKITKNQLRQIIKEEMKAIMAEDFQVGNKVQVSTGGLAGAEGEVIELTQTTKGEPAVVLLLTKNADSPVFGKVGDEVVAAVDKVQPLS